MARHGCAWTHTRHSGYGAYRSGGRAPGDGMPVIYHNRSALPESVERECNARYVDKLALLRESDFLVLVVPLTAESHHAIGASELSLMKHTAVLVNVARD